MYYLAVILSSLAGLVISLYILLNKRSKKPIICPLRGDCRKVVTSEYSKFLHVPVEYLGVAYFGLMLVMFLLFRFSPTYEVTHATSIPIITGLSFLAFLFALYLTYIQIVVIKEFCTWCFYVALVATFIFGSIVSSVMPSIHAMLVDLQNVISGIQLFGVSLGFGGVIFTTVLFFKFLKDYRIEKHEFLILKQISQLVWLGLAILMVGELASYIPHAYYLNDSPKFLLKILLICIVTANGLFFNLFIMPHLTAIPYRQLLERHKDLRDIRKLSFALGAISFVTWLYIFLLGVMNFSYIPFQLMLGGYFVFLSGGLFISQAAEYAISHKKFSFSE